MKRVRCMECEEVLCPPTPRDLPSFLGARAASLPPLWSLRWTPRAWQQLPRPCGLPAWGFQGRGLVLVVVLVPGCTQYRLRWQPLPAPPSHLVLFLPRLFNSPLWVLLAAHDDVSLALACGLLVHLSQLASSHHGCLSRHPNAGRAGARRVPGCSALQLGDSAHGTAVPAGTLPRESVSHRCPHQWGFGGGGSSLGSKLSLSAACYRTSGCWRLLLVLCRRFPGQQYCRPGRQPGGGESPLHAVDNGLLWTCIFILFFLFFARPLYSRQPCTPLFSWLLHSRAWRTPWSSLEGNFWIP